MTDIAQTTIIIGGVAAGMSAATRLRRLDEQANIIVLEQGEHVSFANCGLPYHVGGVIEERDALLLQTPEGLHKRFNLDVRTGTRVTAIQRDEQTVRVVTPGGASETLAYDNLVIATGATPFVPPLPGIERALTLRNVSDMDKIVAKVAEQPRHAVVLGGGFIGLEMAENLAHRGIDTTVVELAQQILPPFDPEMAAYVQAHLEANGVKVITGSGASSLTNTHVLLTDGRALDADLVVAGVGVRPDSDLAVQAGLTVTDRGLIVVDDDLRTSDPHIFAAGDATAKRDHVDDSLRFVTLAQRANRDGRMIADAIMGNSVPSNPVLGTAILGVFGLMAVATGWTETRARAEGRQIRVIHTHPGDHAGYYPGAAQMHLKLVIDAQTDAILGAQGVGTKGVDTRIDVIATAIRGGLRASELIDIELAYAPAFGSAKDAVNMLGYIADNLAAGMTTSIQWHELEAAMAEGSVLVDVRDPEEFASGSIPGAINVPLNALRERHQELPDSVIVHCQVGQRGHTAARLLTQLGHQVVNLDGGYLTWKIATAAKE
ncbi:FAD-dependent oxidoreductase [Stomatohabitans albus]|uniref:FAD-dependent oxidoreductase n=1 Tax=Stomatohabitans albus TaxID=3110766 RepID=UPI00300D4AE6